METFSFLYDGKPSTYVLRELEDGFWSLTCDQEAFKTIIGSRVVPQADSLTEVLEKVGAVNPALMNAMWEPFHASYLTALAKYKFYKTSAD